MLTRGFQGLVGLQLYSLRGQFAADVPATLEQVRQLGVEYVELAGTYGLTPEEFKKQLDEKGLRPISSHIPFEYLRDRLDTVVHEAMNFGLRHTGCAWITHEYPFDERTCREAVSVFNRAGEVLGAKGVTFFYHTHGYEFQPHGSGTLFDLMLAECNTEFVHFELDPFWVQLAGHDPVHLIKACGGRTALLHLKDMKRGVRTGVLTGHSETDSDEALGAGCMDWPAILSAAQEAGIRWYIVEDESPSFAKHIPQSLLYLGRLR